MQNMAQALVHWPVCLHVFLYPINYLMFWPSFHFGARLITPTITIAVSASVFAAAIWEYKDNMNTETDGEDGE